MLLKILGNPSAGRLAITAPPTRGVRRTVHHGNGCRVRWARIILVVIRPNTMDRVTQKSVRWFSESRTEWGEFNHAAHEATNTISGVHSRRSGSVRSPLADRALYTLYTHAGTWATRNVPNTMGTHKSRTLVEWSRKPARNGNGFMSGVCHTSGPQMPDTIIIKLAINSPSWRWLALTFHTVMAGLPVGPLK